ncbi:MAG: hypothetical protein K6E27_05965 [Eubacterium sp.]|nr:hypothetical protein [Eubacterium sp.]
MNNNELERIAWRDANQFDIERLDFVIRKNNFTNTALICASVFSLLVTGGLVVSQLKNSINNWPISVVVVLIAIGCLIFFIRRMHFKPAFKVADVTVEKIERTESSEMPNMYTAVVSQGGITLRNINIYCQTHPEENSKVLLFIMDRDTWSVGIA